MSAHPPIRLFEEVASFLEQRRQEFQQIAAVRREELAQVAAYTRERLQRAEEACLTFICTHNSRRSHLSQIWAKVAADAAGLTSIHTFSGGTEATAMNSRVVESLRRSGFKIETEQEKAANPVYQVRYSDEAEPLHCFSKVYDESPNPKSDFCAILTCSSADESCPIVAGCELRIAIRYEDPKSADGTPNESQVYDERSRQICREMLYMIQQV